MTGCWDGDRVKGGAALIPPPRWYLHVCVPSNINIAGSNRQQQQHRGQTMGKTKKTFSVCDCVLEQVTKALHIVSIRLHPPPPHLSSFLPLSHCPFYLLTHKAIPACKQQAFYCKTPPMYTHAHTHAHVHSSGPFLTPASQMFVWEMGGKHSFPRNSEWNQVPVFTSICTSCHGKVVRVLKSCHSVVTWLPVFVWQQGCICCCLLVLDKQEGEDLTLLFCWLNTNNKFRHFYSAVDKHDMPGSSPLCHDFVMTI